MTKPLLVSSAGKLEIPKAAATYGRVGEQRDLYFDLILFCLGFRFSSLLTINAVLFPIILRC